MTATHTSPMPTVSFDLTASVGPLRAAIDLRWMRPGLAGGIENLSRSFLTELVRLDGFNQYTVLVPPEIRYDFDVRGRDNVKIRVVNGLACDARNALLRGLHALRGRLGLQSWGPLEIALRARALDAEVGLSTAGYIHPDLAQLGNVLVVPDIQHEYHPEFFGPAELAARRRAHTESARQAAHICAISEFTRQTLIERLGIAAERISTTYPAADPIFEPESPARRHGERVARRYGLPAGEYLLFPANTWPHKNHVTAFRALRLLRDRHRLDLFLVCTGARKDSGQSLSVLLDELDLTRRVRFLGYCPREDMPGLYEAARAVVFPSLFEGFGMPLIEAMWCGCPVVCSNTTSLPEVAGDAAMQVDPRSPEELAVTVARVVTDEALRRSLIEQGLRRASDFSWTAFTLRVVRALHEVREKRLG